ncbi:unnamed protein product [Didymodactylos carnosus]|uniref:Uncharacterized protein n=1 Tax=Didymodactylos carnosus TaxID=1234261 RepID=A0A815CSG5_9BILA|nr:unnamed protein product [Didymodactylos carnosus]CAF1287525.1 unnamed protein product [Didymodactylos carnosus]CAF4069552.1 unnamed protein product [Didymodactylos carnosus]CAF4090200.1 unnamed protein product [Didymodactylos carnosus]
MTEDLDRKKLVVVGNGNVGKTSLLYAFKDDRFCQDYVPTLFEGNTHIIEVDNKHIELLLIDTAGQEEYARLRVLGYPNTQVVLICFAFDSPDSLMCVVEKWAPEVKYHCRNVPILLIANKCDLKDDTAVHERIKQLNQKVITTEDALLCAKKIGARNYLECSAKTRQGVREVFEYAAKVALDKGNKTSCCNCCLL